MFPGCQNKSSRVKKSTMLHRLRTFYVASLVQKLGRLCQAGQIGCNNKTNISILANQPTVHSGGVSRGGFAIDGATQSSYEEGQFLDTFCIG